MSAVFGEGYSRQGTAMYVQGYGAAPSLLEEQYRPLVVGYLRALTGSDVVAQRLADEAVAEAAARIASPIPPYRSGETLAAQLLLTATDQGLAYLRRARALQLSGVGGPAPVPQPHPAGPSQWLRGAFDRFRSPDPAMGARDARRVPVRSNQVGQQAGSTRRLGGRQHAQDAGATLSREQLRRRALRAVLADVPPEGAQCLALHLVAGLSAPEIAWVLGIMPEIAAAHVSAGVAAVALRCDSALELLGLSPSLFERPMRRSAPPTIVTADPHASPTLRQPAAVAPTLRLGSAQRAEGRAEPVARPALPTLPAPRRSPTPQSPRVVPVLNPGTQSGRQRATNDALWHEEARAPVATRSRFDSRSDPQFDASPSPWRVTPHPLTPMTRR